jgi:hypothetical protein
VDEDEKDEDEDEDKVEDEDDAIDAVEITLDAVEVNWEVIVGEATVVTIVLEFPPTREDGKVSVIVT